MKVKELKKFLKKFNDDAEILLTCLYEDGVEGYEIIDAIPMKEVGQTEIDLPHLILAPNEDWKIEVKENKE
jgi:hypothetical protein